MMPDLIETLNRLYSEEENDQPKGLNPSRKRKASTFNVPLIQA